MKNTNDTNMSLLNEFITELSNLERLAREVGYLNNIVNRTQKIEDIKKYEQARSKQIALYNQFVEKYSPYLGTKTSSCNIEADSTKPSFFSHCLGGSCSICPYKSLE